MDSATKLIATNVIGDWLVSDDTGLSSKAIASVILTGRCATGRKYHHPLDPSDFGRCLRLMRELPYGTGGTVGVLAGHSKEWKAVIENWEELEKLYDEELPSGKGSKLYARMKELGL